MTTTLRRIPLRVARVVLLPLGWLTERLGSRFYIGLAALVWLLAIAAMSAGFIRGMQNQAYDLIVSNRFNLPPPHPDIVVIDVDEASLAAMAGEYGRWPWPRSVMAELVDTLAPHGPRAIVFDITFVDNDIDHPASDAYMRAVAAREDTTFFSMIRLNPVNDPRSSLRLSDLAGVRRMSPTAPADATVAMTVPYFHRDLAGLRMGTNNLYAGADGVARTYHVYRDVAGWRIGSLPANVVAALGETLPDAPDVLLNWRGPPGVYPRWSFHELHDRLLSSGGAAVAESFRNRIVMIGSSAPSLFDIRPTPVDPEHPGLEILATALDNLHSGDFIRPLPRWIYAVITAGALALLASAFVYNLDYRLLNPAFTTVQAGFVAVSYLCLNYSTVLVDLTAPFTASLVFFFVARGYTLGMNLRRNGNRLFSTRLDTGRRSQVLLLRATISPGPRRNARRLRAALLRRSGMTRLGVAAPRMFRPAPLIDAHFKDTLLVYWLVAPQDTAAALADLYGMLSASLSWLDKHGEDDGQVSFQLDAFEFEAGSGNAWRRPGRNALIRALSGEHVPGSVRIAAQESFAAVWRAHPEVDVPEALRSAGLLRPVG